jgi:intracellular multiplication protein IcmO
MTANSSSILHERGGVLSNVFANGSGCVVMTGSSDSRLFHEVCALAKKHGRIDDVRLLDMARPRGAAVATTFNPFAVGDADAIRELLVSQIGDFAESDAYAVFRERTVALLEAVAPVLVWLRDRKGIVLDLDAIRSSIELGWIRKLAMEKIVPLRDPGTGDVTEMNVADEIPETMTWPLRSYLDELPGFDPGMPLDGRKSDEPMRQHGYAQFCFTATFTQLAMSFRHIFRVEAGAIDMRDVVLNRRILVVTLPALENADATLASLGRLVVASLRTTLDSVHGAAGTVGARFPLVLDNFASCCLGACGTGPRVEIRRLDPGQGDDDA